LEADKKEDMKILHSMGYPQELQRRMSVSSNFAVSFSIICILWGGNNSLAQPTAGAGGASIGIGWPLGCLISGVFALAMGQIASSYPDRGRALSLELHSRKSFHRLADRVAIPLRPCDRDFGVAHDLRLRSRRRLGGLELPEESEPRPPHPQYGDLDRRDPRLLFVWGASLITIAGASAHTIAVSCTVIFLFFSFAIPIALGLMAHG
jgi:hypothetical protein